MMDPNGMFSPITTTGLLGVVDNNIPLQQQQQQQNLPIQQQNPHHLHLSQAVSYAPHAHDTDTHHQQQQLHQSMKHGYPPFSSSRNKQQQQPQQQQGSQVSDEIEDEPSFQADETSGGDPKRKFSPWQRMKWTDTMVRLLIMAVYYIGDEGGSEGTDPMGNKKKSSGLLQKKGKWKSVSRAMMEKGFYVSPQQCEDKFNDLNKRYKRVNDILGKGTACRVVENQNLLDSMDLTPKMKDEVRKLLNSKHLFFREMCAYHNSCGHAGGASNVQLQVEGGSGATTPQNQPQQHQQQPQQQQQQPCFHSTENGVGNLSGSGLRMLKIGSGEVEEEEDEDEDEESEDYSDEDEDESGEGGSKCQQDEDENDGKPSKKRRRKEGGFPISMSSSSLPLMNQMNNEISGVFQDGGKSPWEKKQWIRNKILQLEEQKISYESQGFELEKQRLKWARYSSKKEREMKRAKLENERRRLENERMVLLIRKKEIELMNIQQQQHQQQQHSST